MTLRPGRLLLFVFLLLAAARASEAQIDANAPCGAGEPAVFGQSVWWFPDGEIYCSLVADPREPRSFASLLRGDFESTNKPNQNKTPIASLGLGDSLALVRWMSADPTNGVQLGVAGSIFAQFYIGDGANDLINADYLIGVPVTYRHNSLSARLRFYHQSSHLGDEFLASRKAEKIENLSFESLELLISKDISALRVYGGGERVVRRRSDRIPTTLVHAGIEARNRRTQHVQLVGGLDLKATKTRQWGPTASGRVGLEIRPGSQDRPGRAISVFVEFYDGSSPFGQFFEDDISYVGLGFHIGL